VAATLTNEYAPTDLSVSTVSTASYTGSAETDIIYQESQYEYGTTVWQNNLIGETWCDDSVDGLRCDQQYVRFNINVYVDLELACHETGHAVGLTHGEDAWAPESNTASELGCMETPDSGSRPHLGSHNASQINTVY